MKPVPSPPAWRLECLRSEWPRAQQFLPPELHATWTALADVLEALAEVVRQQFPMEGAVLRARVYARRNAGRLTWARGYRVVSWRITHTNPAAR